MLDNVGCCLVTWSTIMILALNVEVPIDIQLNVHKFLGVDWKKGESSKPESGNLSFILNPIVDKPGVL